MEEAKMIIRKPTHDEYTLHKDWHDKNKASKTKTYAVDFLLGAERKTMYCTENFTVAGLVEDYREKFNLL